MAEYGLTPDGPNIKRLDVIMEDIHKGLSEKWGVNTRQNPDSFLSHILTNIADRLAELWEFGEDVYYAMYPSTAEGRSLDNACQYGGITRETAAKSYYPIHCTGKDGTVLTAETMIQTTMNPPTQLTLRERKKISRSACNMASVKVASAVVGDTYVIAMDGNVYTHIAQSADPVEILRGLLEAMEEDGIIESLDAQNALLNIVSEDMTANHEMILSDNLTTETVTTVLTFGTVETGDIMVPDGTITHIVRADPGLYSIVNKCGYIAGRDEESDAEFRRSYTDKIFNRSSMMLESIRSAILNNVQGVRSVAPYENATNVVDAQGRPPHSIEIVVDGGDSTEIAKQILDKKAAGISTHGDVSVLLTGAYGEDITIYFNRPIPVYAWFRLGVLLRKGESLPINYADILRDVVVDNMNLLNVGEYAVPQEFMTKLYDACPGISYIDIGVFSTLDKDETPTEYPDRIAEITARQRAYTTKEMIEVAIDG